MPLAKAPARRTAPDYDAPAEAGDTPRLGACDILSIAMENGGKKPLDVTILLVGADFSITPIWPADGADNRIATGEARTIDLVQNVPDQAPASEQRLILVDGAGRRQVAYGLRQSRPGRPARRAGRGQPGLRRRRARCWRSG